MVSYNSSMWTSSKKCKIYSPGRHRKVSVGDSSATSAHFCLR